MDIFKIVAKSKILFYPIDFFDMLCCTWQMTTDALCHH